MLGNVIDMKFTRVESITMIPTNTQVHTVFIYNKNSLTKSARHNDKC